MVRCSECDSLVEKYAHGRRCRECYNAYMNEYMTKRYETRMAMFTAALGGVCARCGSTDRLQFDHVDPTLKSFTIASGWNKADHIVFAELMKCELLCHGHHATKTSGENRAREFECCGRTFTGVQAYRGHRRWCPARLASVD